MTFGKNGNVEVLAGYGRDEQQPPAQQRIDDALMLHTLGGRILSGAIVAKGSVAFDQLRSELKFHDLDDRHLLIGPEVLLLGQEEPFAPENACALWEFKPTETC